MQQAMTAEQAAYHFWIQDAIEKAQDAEAQTNYEMELAYSDMIDDYNCHTHFHDINR